MAILKNIDVAKRFNISPATVKNWIDYAMQDKFQLDLTKIGKRYFIKDTPQNIDRLSKLKSKGVKYRSKTGYQDVFPDDKFYDLFNSEEVHDIFSHLENHHYIPYKYFFYGEGARWKYEAFFDFMEAEPFYKKAVENISKNIKSVICSEKNLDNKKLNINIFEMYYGGHAVFCKDTLQNLLENKINFSYISVSTSDENHHFRELYLKNTFGIKMERLSANSANLTNKDLYKYQIDNNTLNYFVYPCGVLNSNTYAIEEIANLRNKLRPNKDFLLADLSLQNTEVNERHDIISSNLLTLHKRFDWLLSMLGLREFAHDNIFEVSSRKGLTYRFLSLNKGVRVNYKLDGIDKSFILEKDTSLKYRISKKYTLDELVNISLILGYKICQYIFTIEDSSAIVVFTPKKISTEGV